MKFRGKVLEAVQWTGGNLGDVVEELLLDVPLRGAVPLSNGALVVTLADSGAYVPVGHWLVRDAAGKMHVCGPKFWSAIFEPAE